MAKNLSKNFGIPSTRKVGIEQHNDLVEKLKNNEVFLLPSQNRGYLSLKEISSGKWKGTYQNILFNTKPSGRFIRITKV